MICLCLTEERKSCTSEMAWRWLNYERSLIFGCNIPLRIYGPWWHSNESLNVIDEVSPAEYSLFIYILSWANVFQIANSEMTDKMVLLCFLTIDSYFYVYIRFFKHFWHTLWAILAWKLLTWWIVLVAQKYLVIFIKI